MKKLITIQHKNVTPKEVDHNYAEAMKAIDKYLSDNRKALTNNLAFALAAIDLYGTNDEFDMFNDNVCYIVTIIADSLIEAHKDQSVDSDTITIELPDGMSMYYFNSLLHTLRCFPPYVGKYFTQALKAVEAAKLTPAEENKFGHTFAFYMDDLGGYFEDYFNGLFGRK